LSKSKVKEILNALQISIEEEHADGIVVRVPTNKADVTREADVIEEILRIFGYDNIRMKPKMEIALTTAPLHSMSMLRKTLGNFLAAQGYLEMMGMSLIESREFAAGPLKYSEQTQVLIDNTSNVPCVSIKTGCSMISCFLNLAGHIRSRELPLLKMSVSH
jgi:phenylalanyl-tRNA synthetase beta chain